MLSRYLTVKETAELLRLSERTVRNKIFEKIFKKGVHYVRQPGIGVRFKAEALVAWLEGTNDASNEEEKQAAAPLKHAVGAGTIPMARGYKI
jgi:excisionase family DNA binding protein